MPVLCTANFSIKPETTDAFIQTLTDMFPETKMHAGFISIRLLRSETSESEYILLQEWKTTKHHQSYMAYRSERGDLERLAAFTAGPTLIQYWDTNSLASA